MLSGGGPPIRITTLVFAPIMEKDGGPFGRSYRADAKFILSQL